MSEKTRQKEAWWNAIPDGKEVGIDRRRSMSVYVRGGPSN